MPYQEVELLGFTPDLPSTVPGASTASMTGFIATTQGFANCPGFGTSSLSAPFLNISYGSKTVKKTDGTQFNVLGVATNLYVFTAPSTLTSIAGAGSPSADANNTWSFAQYGDITLIAGKLQALRSAALPAASAAVAGAPKAQIVIVAGPPTRPFVILFNYNDGADAPNGVFWSTDYTNWTPSIANAIGNQPILEPSGPITAAISYRDGFVCWKADGMYKGTYTNGDTAAWDIQRVASDVGCAGKNMCCIINDVVYFADRRGFWMYDGSYPQRVPGYLHDWWASSQANGSAVDDTCQMSWDPSRHILWASYGGTRMRFWLTWNQLTGKWTNVLGGMTSSLSPITGPREIMQQGDTQYWIMSQQNADSGDIKDANYSDTTLPIAASWVMWHIGDPFNFVEITRFVIPFVKTLNFGSNAAAPGAAFNTFVVSNYNQPPQANLGNQNFRAANITNVSSFDGRAQGHFLRPFLTIGGVFTFNKIGIVSEVRGDRGK